MSGNEDMRQRKVLLTVCNYNANINGALDTSLERLLTLKSKYKDSLFISYWDNGSTKDNSKDILFRYYSNGTIDFLQLSSKNVGKAIAMNRMLYTSSNAIGLVKSDILVNMDSDIIIHDTDFVDTLDLVFSDNDNKLLTHTLYSDDSFNEEWGDNSDVQYDKENLVDINGKKYGNLTSPHKVGGGLISFRVGDFTSVGCYNENLGYNGNGAIYGGDDAMLVLKFFRLMPNGRKLYSLDKSIVHMDSSDSKYKEWKRNCTKTMCERGFGSSEIPSRGFYDD